MRKFLLAFICLLNTALLFGQDNIPYAEKAVQLQKEIWGTQVPEFKTTTVPANLANESAVVLARSYSLLRTSNGRVKFMIITAASTTHTVKLSTLHERVKINDKVALEAYSSLEYQKKLDKTVSLLVSRIVNTNNTYIGAKIIKPDGKEVIVNTSEEVLLKNETKDQKGKLAISGLQVGDILDYYISTAEVNETTQGDSYSSNDNLFMLADEYPVLYYSLDFQFNKKTAVQYIYGNGAPHFEENHNEAGDLLLSLKIRNMAKYQSQLWTSPLRQYPYIEIGSSYTNKFNNFLMGNKKITEGMGRFDANKLSFEAGFIEYPYFDDIEKKLKDFFDTKKALKAAPLDSVMKVLYDKWKFNVYCNYSGDELEDISTINYRNAKSTFAAKTMSMILTDMDIDHDVILVASRNSNTLENVYNEGDYEAMIRINGNVPMYMSFDDIVTHFNEIPARFQGENVVLLHPTRHNSQKYSFTEAATKLPVTAADKNQIDEQLQVSLLPANMQKLKVDRVVKQTGALRHSEQKRLLTAFDVDNGYKEIVKGDELNKRLSQDPKTKKMRDDYNYSFTNEQQNVKKYFSAELKEQFDQEPDQVENFKIINAALENTSPVFQYRSSFVLNNLVKKAGNNYIIDAGKLTGTFYKPEAIDAKRNVDVYMPCARSFKYSIAIAIPAGYTAKGMEEMNVKKINKTGSFTSTAAVNGNTLTITVTRVYNNNFEKATDWPMLMELLNTASNFNSQKVLLEKKG